jgi:hypothetical protein
MPWQMTLVDLSTRIAMGTSLVSYSVCEMDFRWIERAVVMPGLVPGIQPSTSAGASGEMDPGDKHRDDTVGSTADH